MSDTTPSPPGSTPEPLSTSPEPPPAARGGASPAPAGEARARRVALVLALAIPSALGALWLTPRPAYPAEMPPVVVASEDVRGALANLASLARLAPDDDPNEARRRELFLAYGAAERARRDTPDAARERNRELARLAEVMASQGTLDAVRARDVERAMAALRGASEAPDRAAELGGLPDALERYGALVEGRRVAPVVVVEALAMARWNAIHHRPLTEGMDRSLRRGYHGWLVAYAPSSGTDLREAALAELVRDGGMRTLELEGFVRLSRGDTFGAERAFDAAFRASGNVRLRNHALALALASLEPDDEAARERASGGAH